MVGIVKNVSCVYDSGPPKHPLYYMYKWPLILSYTQTQFLSFFSLAGFFKMSNFDVISLI